MVSPVWSVPPLQPLAAEDPRRVGGYRVVARLGAGGMGRVYVGATASGRRVAIKVVRADLADDQEFRRRFQQEVLAAQRVRGSYTAAVIDADLDCPRPWLVTEHIAGPSLAQAVAEVGPLPTGTVRTIAAGVAEALHEIHRAGIVHRDLKPSNVLLAPDGPRVIDFGIARATDSTPLTRTGLRIGTPQFMSPEQAQGKPAGTAGDIFALGSLTYFAATGRTPFGEGPDTTVLYRIVHEEPAMDGCPEPLRSLVNRCLAKAPAHRPSVQQIIEALVGEPEQATDDVWAPTAPAGRAQRLTLTIPPSRQDSEPIPRTVPAAKFAVAAAAGFIVLAVVVGLVFLASRLGKPQSQHPDTTPPATARTLPPGEYPTGQQIYRDEDWNLTLTHFRANGRTLTAYVKYQNLSRAAAQLSCETVSDPAQNTLNLSNGQAIASTETYCSSHPGKVWTLKPGASFLSYATFPVPRDVSRPFSLNWQPGALISGTVSNIVIP